MRRGLLAGIKTPRYTFVRFTCDQCGTPQVTTVTTRAKRAKCIACDRPHPLTASELRNDPTE